MHLMRTLIIFCGACIQLRRKDTSFLRGQAARSGASNVLAYQRRKKLLRLVPCAKKGGFSEKKPWWAWWQELFLDDRGEGRWLSTDRDDLLLEDLNDEEEVSEESLEARNFEAWRRRAEALTELQEAEEDARNMESRAWEDWLSESERSVDGTVGGSWEQGLGGSGGDEGGGSDYTPFPEEGLIRSIRDLVMRTNDDELLFEDRVFKYASVNSAKFLAILVLVPWLLDFVVHDYVLMPFLDTYVKTVPLASDFFDVRRSQKLEMIKALKTEKARFRFEVEIGKAPPLSDDEEWLELHHKAIELRDEWRLENRRAFANIGSDMVYGITLFFLIYFNQSRVALLKFTGYKLLNNISDAGKAFLIILITDIALGYHSESGWQALVESILEHYGLEVDEAAITIFICIVPVVLDACVKLWLFKFLPRLSPNVTNIFREMQRH